MEASSRPEWDLITVPEEYGWEPYAREVTPSTAPVMEGVQFFEDTPDWMTEDKWTRKFAGRFAPLVGLARVVIPADLDAFEDRDEAGDIPPDLALAARTLDLIVEGDVGRGANRRTVLLAIEISTVIDADDVERAVRGAAGLRAAGYDVLPVVAGATIDDGLRQTASTAGVSVFLRPDDVPVVGSFA